MLLGCKGVFVKYSVELEGKPGYHVVMREAFHTINGNNHMLSEQGEYYDGHCRDLVSHMADMKNAGDIPQHFGDAKRTAGEDKMQK